MKIREFVKRIKNVANYIFADETDRAIMLDFQKKKNEILNRNKELVINRLMESIRQEMLKTDGLLISDNQARNTACQIFKTAKEMGSVDFMNKPIKK